MAFANDSMVLALAQEAISEGANQGLTKAQKQFLYMPRILVASATPRYYAANFIAS